MNATGPTGVITKTRPNYGLGYFIPEQGCDAYLDRV